MVKALYLLGVKGVQEVIVACSHLGVKDICYYLLHSLWYRL